MPVNTNIGDGASTLKDTAVESDVLAGMTFHAGKSQKQKTGTMADKTGSSQQAAASVDSDNSRIEMTIPETGKYDSSSKLYAAFSAIRTLIGLAASAIAEGSTVLGIAGTYKGIGDAAASDVLAGKTFSTESLSGATGTMVDKSSSTQQATASLDSDNSRIEMTVPATGKYDTNSKLYAAFSAIQSLLSLTASMIATGSTVLGVGGTYKGVGDASASDVLTGKTFSTASLSGASGSMADKSGTTQSATASLDTTNSRVKMQIPATGKYDTAAYLYAAYSTIRTLIGLTAAKIATGNTILGLTGTYKGVGTAAAAQVLSGYTFSSASLSGASGSMTNRGAVSPSALDPGGSYTIPAGYHNGSGKVSAKTKTVKQMAANAAYGFYSSTETNLSDEDSYTCAAAGICYYNGFSASYNCYVTVTCEIYKNGTLVDSRNIDSSNAYYWRGTMVNKSFSVAKGDVVKIVASVTKASSTTRSRMAHIDATIVMFG